MINFEMIDQVGLITINNPKQYNAITPEMKSNLHQLLLDLELNKDIKVIVINANGDHFSAGSNVKAMGERKVQETIDHMYGFNEIIKIISSSEKVIISAVHGYCIGGGAGIALASDITFAAESAKFGFTFSKIGLVPDCGIMYLLPRLVGRKKAKELIFNNEIVNSSKALELGLVNNLFTEEELLEETLEYARKICNGPSLSFSWVKKILNQSDLLSLEDTLEFERLAQTVMQQTEDHKEGVQAFKEKRKASFVGR